MRRSLLRICKYIPTVITSRDRQQKISSSNGSSVHTRNSWYYCEMKNLAIISTIIFSTIFSSTSYAEWAKVSEGNNADVYLEIDRIRKVDGYIYFWAMTDYLKPSKSGVLSAKIYYEGDCKLFRVKQLSGGFYKQPMGAGAVETDSPENPEWHYPPPDSLGEHLLEYACKLDK